MHTSVTAVVLLARLLHFHDLETLSPEQAARLDGRPALYRIALDSLPGEIDGLIAVDCQSVDGVHRTVRLLPGVDAETRDTLTVLAALQVIEHPASHGFPPLTEYRLVNAAEVP